MEAQYKQELERQMVDLQAELREVKEALSQSAAKNDIAEKIRTGPKLQLDADRANKCWCHVTTKGEVVKTWPAQQNMGRDKGSFQMFHGACSSTPIPLSPPLPRHYWETNTRVRVESGTSGQLIMEMGVAEESWADRNMHVCEQGRSWCISVWSCDTDGGNLCTRVNLLTNRGECYKMSYTPNTQATLHYGVVLDVGRGRLGFIDLDREVVLAKCDVEWSESLLPMFGVGPPGVSTVNMEVISGSDITMTDKKKSLIYDVLT